MYSELAYLCLWTTGQISLTWSSSVDGCSDKTYFSRIMDDCVECPRHSDGCTARLDEETKSKCLTSCQPYFPTESPPNKIKSWTEDKRVVIAIVLPTVFFILVLTTVCLIHQYKKHRHRKNLSEDNQPTEEEHHNYRISCPGKKPITKETVHLHNYV